MSTDAVNLRRARKVKARNDEAKTAAANRAKFGRSAVERTLQAKTTDIAARRLDGHRLTPPATTSEGDGD